MARLGAPETGGVGAARKELVGTGTEAGGERKVRAEILLANRSYSDEDSDEEPKYPGTQELHKVVRHDRNRPSEWRFLEKYASTGVASGSFFAFQQFRNSREIVDKTESLPTHSGVRISWAT